jgi:hypothetical protein
MLSMYSSRTTQLTSTAIAKPWLRWVAQLPMQTSARLIVLPAGAPSPGRRFTGDV